MQKTIIYTLTYTTAASARMTIRLPQCESLSHANEESKNHLIENWSGFYTPREFLHLVLSARIETRVYAGSPYIPDAIYTIKTIVKLF